MDSHSAAGLASPKVDLPKEIILDILEEYLSFPSPKPILFVLVLSKWIYSWMLPILYHTLSTVKLQYIRSGRVVLDTLLRRAPAPSLALVRRLDCSCITRVLTLSSFPNITHLLLWSSCGREWWDSQCFAVTLLPLEELFYWSQSDLNILSRKMTRDSPICSTICRLGFHNNPVTLPDPTWFRYCPKLTRVLLLCSNYDNFQVFIETLPLIFPQLHCCIIAPDWAHHPTRINVSNLGFRADRRVAMILHHLKHFESCGRHFWSAQRTMWEEVDWCISKNPNLHTLTLIDSLSTES
ncbi:hypothetical protein DL96DRAFT_1627293 [Flagelloscypha sp. PMI_526]|nr:hypothetical protein DL96DRAFT_1627293 [Flagelloscypha sp. PMI_526]